jgi:hypothetical protein
VSQEGLIVEKTEGRKSRDTDPLRLNKSHFKYCKGYNTLLKDNKSQNPPLDCKERTAKCESYCTNTVLPGGRRHGHFPQMWQFKKLMAVETL